MYTVKTWYWCIKGAHACISEDPNVFEIMCKNECY